tara:strand:- start:5851 stop:6198 length:348 start_codon:yes stop_codon:yes gene_type:complete
MKVKPLLPSLREKKRYLVFQVISKSPVKSSNELIKSIYSSCLSFLGELGFAKAGPMFLKDKYNSKLQKGIIKVNNKYINHLKAVLTLVKNIDKQSVIISSVGVSGILKKAEKMMV